MRKTHLCRAALLVGLILQAGNATGDIEAVRAAFSAGNYEQAEKATASILEKGESHPDYAESLFLRGRMQWIAKDHRAVIETMSDLVARFPDSPHAPHALWQTGYAHLRIEDEAGAWRAFQQLLEYPANRFTRDAAVRSAYLSLNQPDLTTDDQLATFERVLHDHPTTPEYMELLRSHAQLLWRKSEEEMTLANKERAEEAYRHLRDEGLARGTDHKYWADLNLIALTMEKERLESGSSSNCFKCFTETVEAASSYLTRDDVPDDIAATVRLMLGEAHFFNGDYEDALAEFSRIDEDFASRGNDFGTQVSFSRYMAGLTHMRLGNSHEAGVELLRVLEYPVDTNFGGNNVQVSALEWLGSIAISEQDAELAQAIRDTLDDVDFTNASRGRVLQRLSALDTTANTTRQGD